MVQGVPHSTSNGLFGSRASDKFDWHSIMLLRRDATLTKWERASGGNDIDDEHVTIF